VVAGEPCGRPIATSDNPFELLIDRLRRAGCVVRLIGSDRARAQCPAHPDIRPSLGISRIPDRVLLNCFAGCKTADVVGSLGLRLADLFVQGGPTPEPSQMVAAYDYCESNGELMAQKIRMNPKAFRWRRVNPAKPGNWIYNLGSVHPGLYRIQALVGARRVFCLEGEKAVDLFWSLGLPACSPPGGASHWNPAWSADLQRVGCRELIVLPDADGTGIQHAERVAAICCDLVVSENSEPLAVKVIPLPGLSAGADAYDWLKTGDRVPELLQIVSEAPYWEPGALERARAERKRRLTRKRVAKHRRRRKASTLADPECEVPCNAVNVRAACVTR